MLLTMRYGSVNFRACNTSRKFFNEITGTGNLFFAYLYLEGIFSAVWWSEYDRDSSLIVIVHFPGRQVKYPVSLSFDTPACCLSCSLLHCLHKSLRLPSFQGLNKLPQMSTTSSLWGVGDSVYSKMDDSLYEYEHERSAGTVSVFLCPRTISQEPRFLGWLCSCSPTNRRSWSEGSSCGGRALVSFFLCHIFMIPCPQLLQRYWAR